MCAGEPMEISQVKIFPVHEEKLKAFVSIVIDQCFMVNDIKIIQGKDGLFLSMPSRRKKNGEFKDVAHPLNNETRRVLEERVLAEYRAIVDDQTPRRPDHEDQEAAAPASVDRPRGPQGFKPQALRSSSRDASVGSERSDASAAAPSAGEESGDLERTASEKSGGEEGQRDRDDKTLEEVERLHLRDSFWTVS